VSKPKTLNKAVATISRGRILVLSAPSGGGKSTLVQAVMARTPGLARTVTYTTRAKRPGEVDGRDYHFILQGEFERRCQAGEFLESASVHGSLYGTSRLDVDRLCAQGLDVLLVIDYQGATSLRKQGVDAIYIFILPPSLQELERRLRQRHSEDEAALRSRLAIAPQEMAHYYLYDYVIVNDDFEAATRQLQAIIVADRCRVERLNRQYSIFAELDGWTHGRGTTP
jgi:guanylate kinase